MKISKLSEHIGHGTHMFHVSVGSEFQDTEPAPYLVAANSEEGALLAAFRHHFGYVEGRISDLERQRSVVYEIGEIEP